MTLDPTTIPYLLFFFGGFTVSALLGLNEVRAAKENTKKVYIAALNYQTITKELVGQAEDLIREQDGLIREQTDTIKEQNVTIAELMEAVKILQGK
jgi:hypothetical protein